MTEFAGVPLFAELDPTRRRQLAARSVLRRVRPGTMVAVRGQPAAHLIVVERGTLSAVHETPAGRRRRLGEFPAPCAVDKAAVLDHGGHTASWLAATVCQLRLVPATALFTLIDEVAVVRRHVLARLAQQLRQQQASLVQTSFADAGSRVASWLVQAAGQAGRRVLLPGAQQGLAEAIGASRVTVNRALRRLADQQLIRVEPGAVIILAPELLARRAGLVPPPPPR